MIFELVGADALIGFSSLINNYIKISIPYHTKNVNNFVDVTGFFEYNNSITAKEVTNMDRYKKYASDRKDDICDLLAKLVAIPSVMEEAKPGYPFGEAPAKALETMLAAAKALGFAVNNVDNYYGTADYLPDGVSTPGLAILCHLDVVPEGKGWTYEPFACTEKDGILYGRGVTDDKGPAVSALYALYSVKQLGAKLSKGVRLIFGTNEENGSADIEHYLKKDKMPPMVFTPDASYPLINCEKGMARIKYSADFDNSDIISICGGQVINTVPAECCAVVCGKHKDEICSYTTDNKNGCAYNIEPCGDNIKIICKGKSAHASTPEKGRNAITAMLEMLVSLDLNNNTKRLLSDILRLYPYSETDGSSLGISCSDKSGALTCVLSLINTENGKLTFSTDTRFPISMTAVQLKEKVTSALSDTDMSIADFTGTDAHYASPDSFLVKTLLSVYEEQSGKKGECIAIGGGTYVHGIEGGVAFGVEHPDTDYNIHGADEFVPVSELIDNTAMFANAIEKLCK